MSATAVERAVVEILTEHLDEDWAVPCERQGRPTCLGTNPAAWIVYFWRCCPGKPTHRLWCNDCLQVVLSCPRVRCPRCDVLLPTRESLRRIEPLNRRTKNG